jgi:hypothetical protein
MQIARNPAADLNAVRKVAVVPFTDEAGQRRISGEWETLLLSVGYRVVERGDINVLLQEHSLSLSGVVNPDQSAKIGDVLGVEGLVLGTRSMKSPTKVWSAMGSEQISEPPPVSVRMVDAATARVIWNINNKETGAGYSNITRQGRAVDPSVESMLKGMLESGGWKNIPSWSMTTGFGAGTVLAKNSSMKQAKGMRVGVYPFRSGSEKQDGKAWAEKFSIALMQSGYDVIDRAQLDKVLSEQAISMTGAIRPEDMAQLGKIAGLQGLLMGVIYGNPVCAFSAKLVDAQTGEIYWSTFGESCELDEFTQVLGRMLSEGGGGI